MSDKYIVELSASGRDRLVTVLTAVIQGDLTSLDVENIDDSKLEELKNLVSGAVLKTDVPDGPVKTPPAPLEELPEEEGALVAAHVVVHIGGDVHVHISDEKAAAVKPKVTRGPANSVDKPRGAA